MSNSPHLDSDDRSAAIAIVGMAGRFPGAPDLDTYWDALQAGRESVRRFDRAALLAAGVPPEIADDPAYVPARGVLDGADLFDADLFGFSPAEAELVDPQFRQFLECSRAALEHAGRLGDPEARVGVFAGAGASAYLLHLLRDPALRSSIGFFRALIVNEKDYLATLVSYKLDLRGPALTVQTACSTSLVATHLACQSLLAGECDLALAGGASISFPQETGYLHETSGFLAPDGRCRPFDADGRGIVEGNGVGVVALRRLTDALADGDTIHAVIRGSAVNNDGGARVGFTAPGVDGQVRVIAEALAVAGVEPSRVDFIETHGTGTRLGDPIEVAALARNYGRSAAAPPIWLGAVKSNIGHLGAAAGVAGLCKLVLALRHAQIPPTLHFRRPNPEADLAAGPFAVPTEPTPWPRREHPRCGAVSSFGIGGTNAHLIVEEPPPPPPPPATPPPPWKLLTWSAHDEARLAEQTTRLADHLAARPTLELADVAYTLHVGRQPLAHRGALVARDGADAAAALHGTDRARVHHGHTRGRPRVTFLFAGLGDQHVGMARALDRYDPVFHAALETCIAGFRRRLDIDLRAALYPAEAPAAVRPPGEPATPRLDLRRMLGRTTDGPAPLQRTLVAQPAVFAVGYAIARALMARGVTPDAVAGHSLGEFLAAHFAGVLDLEDAMTLVAARARLLDALAPGAMLTVALGEAELAAYLDDGVSLSAVNAPDTCTLAGEPAAVERLARRLAAAGVAARPLPAERAFHSAMMEPAVAELVRVAAGLTLHPPRLACISNVTGTWLTPAEATDPAYWGRHLRLPVRFAAGAATLCADPAPLLIEVGVGQALGSFVRQAGLPAAAVTSTLRAGYEHDDGRQLLEAHAHAWLAGVALDPALHGADRRRVPLPTYPFARTRHVRHVDPATPHPTANTATPPHNDAGATPPAATPPPGADRPGTPVEEALHAMWRELLKLPDIGVHDNFFVFGGQSLVGVQLLSRIRRTYAVELPLRALFANPTIAELAVAIEDALLAELEGEGEGETDTTTATGPEPQP